MPKALDDTTAAQVGHAFVRWVVNDDPAGVAGFVPDLDVTEVDDAKAARLGHALVDLLEHLGVA
ncbi:MAG TPA: hypothetical protein VG266_07200 [Candidatus Dormibacteraeota bacterium]|jgi:hypothetical protein|nr:hypothetical protein [Candidatus Dormibacteraeota bacterium]